MLGVTEMVRHLLLQHRGGDRQHRGGERLQPPVRAGDVLIVSPGGLDQFRDRGPLTRLWESIGYDEINWTYTATGR